MYIATINMNKTIRLCYGLLLVLKNTVFEGFWLFLEKQTKSLPSSVLCLVFVSLVSHENIEIFVVIHEKAIQRSLKYEKETKSSEKTFCLFFILTAGERKQGSASKQKTLRLTQQMLGCCPQLVEGSLEDESDVALLTSQLLGTEGAGGVEGVCAVRQWDLTPEGRCLLRTNMATRVKGVSRWGGVDIKPRFTAQPQRYVRPFSPTHGTLPVPALPALPLLAVVAPIVVAVHVATLEVDPGLLLVRRVLAMHGREGQRVEAHRTLRAGSIDLLPQCLQVFEGGSARQAFSSAPQQGCTAKVDERTVDQLVTLSLHLEQREFTEMSCCRPQ